MATLSNTLVSLQKTSKGQLKYDRCWYEKGGVEGMLKECTSPPAVTAYKRSPGHGRSPCSVLDGSWRDQQDDHSSDDETWTIGLRNEEETSRVADHQINEVSTKARRHRVLTDRSTSPDRSTVTTEDNFISPEVTLVEVAIKNYEDKLKHQAKTYLDERQMLFEKTSKLLVEQAENALDQLYYRKATEAQRQLAAAEADFRARFAEKQRMEQQLRERSQQHARRLDTKMREAEAGRRQLEQEEAKKRQEAQQRLQIITKAHQEIQMTSHQVSQLLATCQHMKHVPDTIKKAPQVFAQIMAKMESLQRDAITSTTSKELQDALQLTATVRSLNEKLKTAIDIANKKGQAEAEKALSKDAAVTTVTSTSSSVTSSTAVAPGGATAANVLTSITSGGQAVSTSSKAESTLTSKASVKADEMLCVDEHLFVKYQKLQDNLAVIQAAIAPIMSDPTLKKFKSDLQKSVNTPINAITPTSGNHLMDKLHRLSSLLHGHHTEVGGRKVSANDHPAGISFCKDLFARRIVKQGEEQVSSKHESAFAIAAVTVGVMCEFTDVADLVLAHFHASCPYIVPYYLPRKPGQTSEDYYKSLGYLYVNGAVEEQDKFLKRMSGIMRLYAAILVSSPPRGVSMPNPHGVRFAWQWLASVLNLDPRPYVTATMIYDMLQVAGHALFETYSGQFLKLLALLYTDYMPKIKQLTPEGSGGPVVRLELFLQKCITTNAIPKPDGMLPRYFW